MPQFLVRRGARVLPLYVAVVLASFAWQMTAPDSLVWAYPIDDWHDLLIHLAMIRGASVLWSVPVEIQFYLLLPLIWIAWSQAPRPTIAGTLAVMTAIYLYEAWLGWPRFNVPSLFEALPYFLSGLVLSRLGVPVPSRWWDIPFALALLGCALTFPRLTPRWLATGLEWWTNPVFLLVMSALLLASVRSWLADRILGSRPFRFLGQVSYGVYLLHFPIIFAWSRFTDVPGPAWILLVLVIASVLTAATITHILIERPARDAINRWFDRHQSVPVGQPS